MTTPTQTIGTRSKSRAKRIIVLTLVAILALTAVAIASSFLSGYGLNLRGFGRASVSLVKAVMASRKVTSLNQGEFRNILFLHHSVGTNLLNDTNLRQNFSDAGFYLWDHAYNWQGLRDPSGNPTGYSYNIPEDGADPHDYARIFAQPLYSLPINALSSMMQYEVIMFKSCFPASSIQSDQQLQDYKTWYLGMRDFMDKHPEKIFIALTPPPLLRKETTAAEAQRARAFANWLKSAEFTKGHPNVFVFDLFDVLSDDNPLSPDVNTLKVEYSNGVDSHPNKVGNQVVAPQLFDFVTRAIEQYANSVKQPPPSSKTLTDSNRFLDN